MSSDPFSKEPFVPKNVDLYSIVAGAPFPAKGSWWKTLNFVCCIYAFF